MAEHRCKLCGLVRQDRIHGLPGEFGTHDFEPDKAARESFGDPWGGPDSTGCEPIAQSVPVCPACTRPIFIDRPVAQSGAGGAMAGFVMPDSVYKCPACQMPLIGTPEGHLPGCVVREATETNLRNDGWISPYEPEPAAEQVTAEQELLTIACTCQHPVKNVKPFDWQCATCMLPIGVAKAEPIPQVDAELREAFVRTKLNEIAKGENTVVAMRELAEQVAAHVTKGLEARLVELERKCGE